MVLYFSLCTEHAGLVFGYIPCHKIVDAASTADFIQARVCHTYEKMGWDFVPKTRFFKMILKKKS